MTDDRDQEQALLKIRDDAEREALAALQGRPSLLTSLTPEQIQMIRDLPPDIDDTLGASEFRKKDKPKP